MRILKGVWEIFDKNRIQNNNLNLIHNITRNLVVKIFLGEIENISPFKSIRKQRLIHRLMNKIIHFTQFLWKGIELGRMVLDGIMPTCPSSSDQFSELLRQRPKYNMIDIIIYSKFFYSHKSMQFPCWFSSHYSSANDVIKIRQINVW